MKINELNKMYKKLSGMAADLDIIHVGLKDENFIEDVNSAREYVKKVCSSIYEKIEELGETE